MNALVKPHIAIDGIEIRTDAQGRFCLNDLHKASGGEQKNQPRYFLANEQTQALVQELTVSEIPLSDKINNLDPVSVIRGGLEQGTYVVKELVYSYAMWISASFNLKVIRTFDAVATGQIQPVFDITNPVHLLQAIEVQAKQNIELTQKVEVLEPKAAALEVLSQNKHGYLCLTDAAKHLHIKRCDLTNFMANHKLMYRRSTSSITRKGKWAAYDRAIKNGWLFHDYTAGEKPDGTDYAPQVLVTPKGLVYLAELISKELKAVS